MPREQKISKVMPIRIVIVTMDTHVASATERARGRLKHELPGLEFSVHAASEWSSNPDALIRCLEAIRVGDIIINTMLFLEEHFQPLLAALEARRDSCDAMICMMSASAVTRLTRIGRFRMDGPQSAPMSLLKRLRGSSTNSAGNGASQMKMLRRIPQLLRFIPGTAQDVRAYFMCLQYWLAGSEENMANLVRFLVDRYAGGERASVRGTLKFGKPIEYPETGIYHPSLPERVSENAFDLPSHPAAKGTIGLLVLRSYVLAGNSAHYDGVIHAYENAGYNVLPVFATGLDARDAINKYFLKEGRPTIDALVSLTGFSLVGGPAYNDSKAAEEILALLDVPYIAAHPTEFQTLDQWGQSDRGLLPVESTIMVSIPELDGATSPIVFGGRTETGRDCQGCARRCTFPATENQRDMHVCVERTEVLVARTASLVALRQTARAQRKVGIVLFNFPPNAGNTGTAAYLSVFESLHNMLLAMRRDGYTVDIPDTPDSLRLRIIEGNASRYGAIANVYARISADDHVARERYLNEIEAQWGPAPGKQQSDGSTIHVLGHCFGNVFVGIQPSFGYEGDPMRLLFEKGFAPTHAFSAFYRWIREDFGAHVVLHFGTHGALEFMPGKQTGLSGDCWPDRLIGSLPNIYLYASNNPSEGAIAKRRGSATTISYLTPPVASAGLYRGLIELKSSVDRWRQLDPGNLVQQAELAELIQAQASALELSSSEPAWNFEAASRISKLSETMLELEYALIPHGLHVVGQALSAAERVDMLQAMGESSHGLRLEQATLAKLVDGVIPEVILRSEGAASDTGRLTVLRELAKADLLLTQDHEVEGLLRGIDGRYIRPAPGGDVLRNPEVLPTGRNLHGFDPFRIPSAYAVQDGTKQAMKLLDRHIAEGNPVPETVALVLWGTDNLKTEGAPIAQALALMGAAPRFDTYGRLAGATLIPLEQLRHPRIDVVISLSGIFRDLLPLQIKLLADAAFLAASSIEPVERNFVRKHALAYQELHGGDLETASLRVFGNAEGAYGSNVNNLIESGRWQDEDELAEVYTRRKGFAYGRNGRPLQQPDLLKSVLGGVALAYQNLDSVELGVTSVDNYFDTLGGISRAVRRAKGGADTPVYIGDQTRGEGVVRTLSEQVSLETRTRALNPKWYEGMLKHGYEGVRQIETHVTNTMGWSAITGQVEPWVYQKITETYMLDPEMRERLAALNPTASVKLANRLLEAQQRDYWRPDETTLAALQQASEQLEDRMEGVGVEVAA